MLYPTELRAAGNKQKTRNGRGERIRTFDILLPKQALYRAELRPEQLKIIAELRLFERVGQPLALGFCGRFVPSFYHQA
jgi:hypothetical protein